MQLANKIAVITGGTNGLGLATARLFREQGARVVVNARSEQRRTELLSAHPNLFDAIFVADVADISSLEQFYTAVGAQYGHIDILFLNAGISGTMSLEHISESFFDTIMNVNVKGVLFSIKYAMPFLVRGASVILTTSVNNQMGMPRVSVYAASKAAVRSFARTLSAELAPRGIRVNAVSPGPVDTGFIERSGCPAELVSSIRAQISEMTALKRWAEPEEIARVVAFFASDASSYIIGAELEVDGGMVTL